jgi:hypothetical protein
MLIICELDERCSRSSCLYTGKDMFKQPILVIAPWLKRLSDSKTCCTIKKKKKYFFQSTKKKKKRKVKEKKNK